LGNIVVSKADTTADFAYNNTHTSLGVSLFKANYGFDPSFGGGVPSTDQCLLLVGQQLKQLAEVQEELKECLSAAHESMKTQFDKHVRETPKWGVGYKLWLDSQHIPTT
jgi:hypothetical protein